MNRVLFLGNLALGTDQSALADGQACLLVETVAGPIKYWATADVVKRFCIVAKQGNVLISTPYMEARPYKKILKSGTPIAGTVQTIRLTATALGDSSYGSSSYDEWVIHVDLRGGRDLGGNENQARTYIIRGTFLNATAFYAAVAAEINSSTAYNNDITAVAAATYVDISPSAAYADATITVGGYHQPYSSLTVPQVVTWAEQVAWTPASGDAASLIKEFNRSKPSMGSYYTTDVDIPKVATPAASGTYKTLYMWIQNTHHTTNLQAEGNEVYAETVLAMPNAATTNFTNLQAALEEILAGTFVASSIS